MNLTAESIRFIQQALANETNKLIVGLEGLIVKEQPVTEEKPAPKQPKTKKENE